MTVRLVAERYNGVNGSMDVHEDYAAVKKRISSLDAKIEVHWQELCEKFVTAQIKPLKATIDELVRELRSLREDEDELLDPKAAAALLKVHEVTVVKWARQGIIPSKRIGKLHRFSRKDLSAMRG